MTQVQPIIQAAEQAATGIIEDAEARARIYVEESRRRADELAKERAEDLWTLTDGLIARAEAVKKQSDELLTALNQTKRGAEAALQAAPVPPTPPVDELDPPPPPAADHPETPVAEGSDPVPPPADPGPDVGREAPPDAARLLATQMAVAGGSRSEIANRLLEDYEIEDPESVLDDILGPA